MKRGPARAGNKRSGLPSTRASDAAERSPAVFFANLKADMLLQKQLQVLKRAEKSLVHRIVIDQKILFRRFQAKLRRSKLARARLYEDKDTERELRARDLHVLNSNCGQDRDDFEFLKKLEYRPCVTDESLLEKGMPRSTRKIPEITDEDTEEFIRLVMEDQELDATEKNLMTLTTIGRLIDEARLGPNARSQTGQDGPDKEPQQQIPSKVILRPSSSLDPGIEVMNEFPVKKKLEPANKSRSWMTRCDIFGEEDQEDEEEESRPRTSSSSSQQAGPDSKDKKKVRPLTCPQPRGKLRRKSPETRSTLPRASLVPRNKSAHGHVSVSPSPVYSSSRRPSRSIANVFKEQKKVDVVALRLAEARATDLTPKVGAFLKSLLDLDKRERAKSVRADGPGAELDEALAVQIGVEGERQVNQDKEEEEETAEELKGDRKFDYYATKMATYAASVKKDRQFSLPGTPEEINMKLVGDQTIKSITMPALCFDFHEDDGEQTGHDNGYGGEGHQYDGTTNILIVQSD